MTVEDTAVAILGAVALIFALVWVRMNRGVDTAVGYARVQGKQAEGIRIAGALHDDVLQVMTACSMLLDGEIRRAADERQRVSLTHARELFGQTMERTRTLMFELHPPSLEEFGLKRAVEEKLAGSEFDGIGTVVVMPSRRYAPEVESVMWRTMSEILHNSVRHAKCHEIVVSVHQNGELRGYITDDGSGFDPAEARERAGKGGFHLGILRTVECIQELGGSVRVESTRGKGTTVFFNVPYGQLPPE